MKLSDNMHGAVLMLACTAAFALNDACIKALAGTLPLFQTVFLRGVMTTALLLGFAIATGGLNFRLSRKDWGWLAIRTLAEALAAFLFITAIFNMPIGNATAILMALPLLITLAGAVFLKETFGWRRLVAILVGFVGILLIVQPGAEGYNFYAIYALLSVLVITGRDLIVRKMSADVPSLTIAIGAAAGVGALAGLASVFEDWQPVTIEASALLFGASVFIIGGYIFSVSAMRVGEISFIAPFRYAGLVWALLLGFVVFGEWPDALAQIGILIVVGTGLFTMWRDHAQGNRQTPADPEPR